MPIPSVPSTLSSLLAPPALAVTVWPAKTLTVSTGCPAGLDAIASAAKEILAGRADMAIAGGADAPITLVLPSRAQAGPRDTVNIRALLDGYQHRKGQRIVARSVVRHYPDELCAWADANDVPDDRPHIAWALAKVRLASGRAW